MTRHPEVPIPVQATLRVAVARCRSGVVSQDEDLVTVEEPLEIRVVAESAGRRQHHSVAVTMRTPGEDFELSAGFLVGEGVVGQARDIWRIEHCEQAGESTDENVVEVHLAPSVGFDVDQLSRNVVTSSACGICGRTSIEAVQKSCANRPRGDFHLSPSTLMGLTDLLAARQPVFSHTGGLHAAALFDSTGRLCDLREDVGRHNALDKLVGGRLLSGQLPISQSLILVSGRVSFELVQKSVLAGIPILAAVGAPSSLAIELASEYGMTLIGFLGPDRFNVYCGKERIEDV